jgi:hypothetical protein
MGICDNRESCLIIFCLSPVYLVDQIFLSPVDRVLSVIQKICVLFDQNNDAEMFIIISIFILWIMDHGLDRFYEFFFF